MVELNLQIKQVFSVNYEGIVRSIWVNLKFHPPTHP